MGTSWICLILDVIIYFLNLLPIFSESVITKQHKTEIRLAGGITVCSGRVEVRHNHAWGTVCDNSWDIADASVACREVGCGKALGAPGGAKFGHGSGPIWLDQVNCTGEEDSVTTCPAAEPFGVNNCDHSKDAGIECAELREIRLTNGPSRCAGRVEILHEKKWGTVCDDGWDLKEAKVVCRYLGCGAALSAPRGSHFEAGTGPIWLAGIKCNGTEKAVSKCSAKVWGDHDCTHLQDSGVVCAGPKEIRLVNGTSHCSGRLEVLHNQEWGTVCDDVWDLSSAQVVCRELGCGVALSAPKEAHFGRGHGPIWLKGAECKGTESTLKDCQLEPWGLHNCEHGEDAGVVCSEIRLVNGSGFCSGRVEVLHAEEWGTICDNGWGIEEAQVICRGLSCGSALKARASAWFGHGTGRVWLDEVTCEGTEKSLYDCPSRPWGNTNCSHESDAGIECADPMKLKLVDGLHQCSGRVEVLHHEQYGTICDHGWDLNEATVVCRHLDCGTAISAPHGAHFGQGSDPIWLDEVTCTGKEAYLSGCLARPWGNQDCTHAKDASVVCSDNLRLVNGSNRCSGTVEIRLPNRGKWGTICDRTWDIKDAEVVCKELRCGKALSAPGGAHFGRGSGSVWLDNIHCKGTEHAMIECRANLQRNNKCHHGQDAGAICSGVDQSRTLVVTEKIKVKLVNGPSHCSGRVELLHHGQWGTICDDGWNMEEASVVCRQLDCGAPKSAPGRAKFGRGAGPIWLDDVKCSGTELDLGQCPASPWGENDCSHREDAGVVCSEKESSVRNIIVTAVPSAVPSTTTTTTTASSFLKKLRAQLDQISENVRQIKEKQESLETSLYSIKKNLPTDSTETDP